MLGSRLHVSLDIVSLASVSVVLFVALYVEVKIMNADLLWNCSSSSCSVVRALTATTRLLAASGMRYNPRLAHCFPAGGKQDRDGSTTMSNLSLPMQCCDTRWKIAQLLLGCDKMSWVRVLGVTFGYCGQLHFAIGRMGIGNRMILTLRACRPGTKALSEVRACVRM